MIVFCISMHITVGQKKTDLSFIFCYFAYFCYNFSGNWLVVAMGWTLYVPGVIKPPVRDWSLILIEYSGNHLKHFSIDKTELFENIYQTPSLLLKDIALLLHVCQE